MLKWCSDLYIGEGAKKKSKSIIRKINNGTGQLGTYVVTLANNPANHLEVFSSHLLLQTVVRDSCPMIVGIASGYEEAILLVKTITEEAYEKTGSTDIKAFIENNEATLKA